MFKEVVKTILGKSNFKDNSNDPEAVRYRNSEVKRYDVINYLISKYHVQRYLEIGVLKGDNIRKVNALHKDGVDPGAERHIAPEVNYRMTSDAYFELIKDRSDIQYDLIFIDGLHHADQVQKDIHNSLNHITPGGFILLHDCNPVSFESQLVPRKTMVWNGDPWKAFVAFKGQYPGMQSCVVDTDYGVGVIRVSDLSSKKDFLVPYWETFDKNRKHYLNLIHWEEFKALY